MSLKEQAVIAMIKECIQPLLELKKGFEKQENRVDDITEGLPAEKYPSVNAVINFVKNKINDFSNNLNMVYVKLLDFDSYKTTIENKFKEKQTAFDNYKTTVNNEVTVLNTRIDEFTKLEDGSTTGDAELNDAKIDFKGNVYSNVGAHIRSVTSKIDCNTIPILERTANLFDCTQKLNDGYVINNDGTLRVDEKRQTSDYIEVKPNTNYIGNFTNHIAYYDENKSTITVTNMVYSAKTPSNCKFVRIDWLLSYNTADEIMLVEGDTLPQTYLPPYIPKFDIPKEKIQDFSIEIQNLSTEIEDLNAKVKTHWYSKNWIAYGDSISAINNGNGLNLGWAAYVNLHYGFSSFYGRGVGGQSFIWNTNTFYANSDGTYAGRYGMNGLTSAPEGTTEHKGCFCSWDRIKTMIPDNIKNTIDLVFIMGGTNDIGLFTDRIKWQTPKFSAENVTDTDWVNTNEYNGGDYDITTFTGAICSAIMKMQVRCPNAVIVIGTPLSKWSSQNVHTVNGVTMEDVASVIIKTAKYMSIPVIDVNGTCGINGFNYSKYITDGTHPYCVAGQKMLARTVNGGLANILPLTN